MKLALGTAQFGMSYGITNQIGRVNSTEVKSILDCALSHGITTIDTANAYGQAEETLGYVVNNQPFQIVTKTKPINHSSITDLTINQIRDEIYLSLKRLRCEKIYGILVHHGEELLLKDGERLFEMLSKFKQNKQVSKIGVSVYTANTARKIIDQYPIDIIQVPLNILDQRMVNSGMLNILKNKGIEIHVRSAFLQGVVLAKQKELPKHFNLIHAQLTYLEEVSRKTGKSKLAIALNYLKSISEIDKILIGILNVSQLQECISAFSTVFTEKIDYSMFRCDDNLIIDPSNWVKQT